MEIQKFNEFPEEDLNVINVELQYQLPDARKAIHSPELTMQFDIEDEDYRRLDDINKSVIDTFKENKIGYNLVYLDAITIDYSVFILIALQDIEKIKEILNSIPNVKVLRIGKISVVSQNEDNHVKASRKKFNELMFGI